MKSLDHRAATRSAAHRNWSAGLPPLAGSAIENQGVKEALQASSTIKEATLERHDYQKAGWSRAGGSGALWEHAELAAGGPGGNILSAYPTRRFSDVCGPSAESGRK